MAKPRAHYELHRDPADSVFIYLVIETGAEYLVSRDRDLLDLCADADFSAVFPGLKIVDPSQFLKAVRATLDICAEL